MTLDEFKELAVKNGFDLSKSSEYILRLIYRFEDDFYIRAAVFLDIPNDNGAVRAWVNLYDPNGHPLVKDVKFKGILGVGLAELAAYLEL